VQTAVPTDTPQPTDTPPPTDTPLPFVEVIEPADNGTMSCDNPAEEGFCLFHVRGRAGGVDSFINYRLYVFVFPSNPPGAGWYLQKLPAPIESSGDWTQPQSYLGAIGAPAEKGDEFKIRAVLVRTDATVNSRKLEDMANSKELIVLPAVEDIDGIVAISDIIDLTLNR
jgi:hypothetical protein